MPVLAAPRFLIKVPPRILEGGRGVLPTEIAPLYPDERAAVEGDGSLPEWFIHTPPIETIQEEHPWDAAHAVAQTLTREARASGAAEVAVDLYVEPDLIHRRYVQVVDQLRTPLTEGAAWPASAGLNPDYPPTVNDHFSLAWHLERGRFPEAWVVTRGAGVRIAHLDTGYYPAHESTPARIYPEQGRNYFEGDPHDVTDPGNELNAGHGTATLALLAGKDVDLQYAPPGNGLVLNYHGTIGGAPDSDIVPVRIGGIGGSVVHLYSSSMAKGLHHALGEAGRAPCDVVSLSHGGIPTKVWVDQVNRLYEAGIVLAAASGDNFYAVLLDIASHFTVYPSAWYRVITVTGETFAGGPYTTDHFGVMQGSWGPLKVMKKAVGACTPNVPWMRLGNPTAWEMDGGGTSASTPQVAAACALWLSTYGGSLGRDWRRVAACRAALFESVTDAESNVEKIGLGALDASAMLDAGRSQQLVADALLAHPALLKPIEPDRCSWPLFRYLFGLPPPGKGSEEMMEVEALQLAYRSRNPRLQQVMQDYPEGVGMPARVAEALRSDFLNEPDMSRTLRQYLQQHLAAAMP